MTTTALTTFYSNEKIKNLTFPSEPSLMQDPKSASRMCPWTSRSMLSGFISLSDNNVGFMIFYSETTVFWKTNNYSDNILTGY